MKTTKKVLQILLPLVLLLCVFASCEGNAAEPKQTTAESTTAAPQTTAQQTTASELQSTSSTSSSSASSESATAESTTAAPEPLIGYITADGAQAVELISKIHKGEDVGITTFEYVLYRTTADEAEDFLRPLTGESDCALLIIERYDYTAYTYVSLVGGKYYRMRLTSTMLENGDPAKLAEKMTEYDYFYRIDQKIGEIESTDFVLTTVEGLTAEQIRSMILDSVQFDPYTAIVGGVGLPAPSEDGSLPSIDAKYITLDPEVITDYILAAYNDVPIDESYFRGAWNATEGALIIFQFEERGSRDHAMIFGDAKDFTVSPTEYTYLCRKAGRYYAATLIVSDIRSLSKDELVGKVADQLAMSYGYMLEGVAAKYTWADYRITFLSDDQSLTAQDALEDKNKGLLPVLILKQDVNG